MLSPALLRPPSPASLSHIPQTGRGIGREIALELARRGASIIVNFAHSRSAARETVAAIRSLPSSPRAHAIQADVSCVPSIVALFESAVAVWGRLDIVMSNSGVVSFLHVRDVTPDEFDRVFGVNTRGQFFVAREAFKHLEVGGRLIMMGSITGQAKAVPRHAVYSGSKGAIETVVRCLAVGKNRSLSSSFYFSLLLWHTFLP